MFLYVLDSWPKILLTLSSRYLLLAGIFWVVWYVLLRKKATFRKIQQRFPGKADYRREVLFSLSSLLIFSAFPAITLLTPLRDYTQYYTHVEEHGRIWFWIAFPVIFVLHDAYFYWMHRLMHHPKLFRTVHLIHHKSTNPSPWAALAFHPLEAVIEAGIFLVLVMIMPVHSWHLIVFFAVQMLYNVYGHLGWELYPRGFSRHWIGKWINTSLNHNGHHQFFKGNYGLYFLWWDRWCGTLQQEYDERFDEVKTRQRGGIRNEE